MHTSRLACIAGILSALAILTIACAPTSQRFSSQEVSPLESDINFSFEETSGDLILKLWTEQIYGTGSNGIAATLQHIDDNQLLVQIRGIDLCEGTCDTGTGPAWRDLPLPTPRGVYTLTFEHQDVQTDAYSLRITPSEILLAPPAPPVFTLPQHLEWKRLPKDTLWLVIHDAGAIVAPYGSVFMKREDFETQAQDFLEDMEKLEVQEFIPEEGYYTNAFFIPPWLTWQKPSRLAGDRVEIPAQRRDSFFEFRWPIIKYYLNEALRAGCGAIRT